LSDARTTLKAFFNILQEKEKGGGFPHPLFVPEQTA
jgi:hypothetical protein